MALMHGVVDGTAQSIDELHLLNGLTGDFQETRVGYHSGKAPGTGDSNVEAFLAV